jgi:hypothetical protein
MKPISRSQLAILVLIAAMLACNAPATNQPISVNDEAATVIAMTLQALTQSSGDVTFTATSAVTPVITAATTTIATKGVTATITPTYSTPMLTVLEQTNCREGPGQDYQVIFTYLAKKQLEIAGRYDPTNYWLVKSPDSRTGTCWLWGEYVELSGSYWVVPTVTPPPTATIAPPQAPSIEDWHFDCSGGAMNFSLKWADRATNETGYRIFRDGEAVVELPANSISFTESIPFEAGQEIVYYLQVFGPSGTANSSLMKLTC